jgi:hypothetical protein
MAGRWREGHSAESSSSVFALVETLISARFSRKRLLIDTISVTDGLRLRQFRFRKRRSVMSRK